MQKLQACTSKGFTRTDLLAGIVSAGLIAFLSIPTIGQSQSRSAAAVCLTHLREVTAAWTMYAADNHDMLVQSYHGGDAINGTIRSTNPSAAPWAVGWLDWTTSPDNTNSNFIRDVRYAKLAPYLDREDNVHKCPFDRYLSRGQRMKGWAERTRSISIAANLGEGNFLTGPADNNYIQIKKLAQLANPSPSETILFLDEHPDSINDPAFLPPLQTSWVDLPASYHQGAGSFSFADGHVELHKWTGSATHVPVYFSLRLPASAQDPDRSWVSYHFQRRSEQHY